MIDITHIEIRRVQNGFVVAGLNTQIMERYAPAEGPQRVTLVATNEDELCDVLRGILAAAEVQWLPTNDFEMLEMHRRMKERERNGASCAPAPAPTPFKSV